MTVVAEKTDRNPPQAQSIKAGAPAIVQELDAVHFATSQAIERVSGAVQSEALEALQKMAERLKVARDFASSILEINAKLENQDIARLDALTHSNSTPLTPQELDSYLPCNDTSSSSLAALVRMQELGLVNETSHQGWFITKEGRDFLRSRSSILEHGFALI